MNKEYKDIEVKSFTQNILKILVGLLSFALIVSIGMFFYKLDKIDKNYDINNHIHEIALDYKSLMLNIERPSIYTNFESSGSKLTDISIKSQELIKLLTNNNQLDPDDELNINSSLSKLKDYITTFNSLLGTSGGDLKSLNVLYSKVNILDIKQKVLEFVFSVNVDKRALSDFITELEQLIEHNSIKMNELLTSLLALKDSLKTTKEQDIPTIQENIAYNQHILKSIDDEKTFLILSIKLLNGIKSIQIQKDKIKNFTAYEDYLSRLKLESLKEIDALSNSKNQIIVASFIICVLIILLISIIFKYGYDLSFALNILYKAFLNSPIQQVLINPKNKKGLQVEFVNDNFSYNALSPNEQSQEVRKTQAINFYDSLTGIIDLNENAKGFDYGTLVQENHNKIQPYNENEISSRKETRYFSIFRKSLGNQYELINKVDVTKKILQIKDFKTKLDNIQKRLDTDHLTGLLSLQALQDRELRDDKANKSNIFLYIKIDNFNDLRLNYSTILIDEIIKSFSNSLKNAINREDNDEVLKNTDIYHLQLDEFCIVYKTQEEAINTAKLIQKHFCHTDLENIDLNDEANNIKRKFELNISSGIELKDLELNIGISTDRDIRKSNKEVINRLAQAILASYETVRCKTAWCIYQEGLGIEKQHAEQQRVASQIRHALDNDKIFVVCQGVHNSLTRSVSYYEVLVRLRDENNQVVSPGLFLDVARKVGLYKDIQKVVITKVFELIKKYPKENFSINLANSDIIDDETRTYFLEQLEQCTRPSALCIEILESEGIEKYEDLEIFLNNVSAKGCKIAIDDFGSGYSNFYRLLKIKFDYLKIDGSIIESLVSDSNARIVLETLVGFAHKQGYRVVAEFVKNQDILKIVQEYNIEKAQGYELSKPEEPEHIFT